MVIKMQPSLIYVANGRSLSNAKNSLIISRHSKKLQIIIAFIQYYTSA